MDFVYDPFMNILKRQSFGWIVFQWRNRSQSDFIKKYLHLYSEDEFEALWVWNDMRLSKWWKPFKLVFFKILIKLQEI